MNELHVSQLLSAVW